MAAPTPWAILLCKFLGLPNEPKPKSFFEKLFCQQGAGMGGLLDYWEEISYGSVDLSESQVFGWFQMDHTLAQDKLLNRWQRIFNGIQAAGSSVYFPDFYGVVVCLNAANIDMGSVGRCELFLDGQLKTYGLVVLDATPTVWSTAAAAHETGHGYGLNHSWSAMPNDVEYGDSWDIMSYGNDYYFQGPTFGNSGPGLAAPYLIQKGWMPDWRVETVNLGQASPDYIYLTALGHPEGQGSLAARADLIDANGAPVSYVVEYRYADRWNAGFGWGPVLVHEVRANGLSYLKEALGSGDQYINGDYDFVIEVNEIDVANRRATVLVGRNASVWLSGQVSTNSTEIVGQGIYHFSGFGSWCPPGDYPYTHQHRKQTAEYLANTNLLDKATIQYDWYVESTPLAPQDGTIGVMVWSRSALPPPSGAYSELEALIEYWVMGSTVVLKNRPEDGNYTLTLRVHAHDADGRSAWGAVELDFDGDLLMFGNNYYPMALKCLMHSSIKGPSTRQDQRRSLTGEIRVRTRSRRRRSPRS